MLEASGGADQAVQPPVEDLFFKVLQKPFGLLMANALLVAGNAEALADDDLTRWDSPFGGLL